MINNVGNAIRTLLNATVLTTVPSGAVSCQRIIESRNENAGNTGPQIQSSPKKSTIMTAALIRRCVC